MPSGRTASGGSSSVATQVSRRWGFGTRAGQAAGRSRSLPRSPRRTGGSGVALAGRATANSPPCTWRGVVAGRAAASRRGCASRAAAGRGALGRHSSLCRLTAVGRTGFPARCYAMAVAAMTVAAVRRGIRSHQAGWPLLLNPSGTPSPSSIHQTVRPRSGRPPR